MYGRLGRIAGEVGVNCRTAARVRRINLRPALFQPIASEWHRVDNAGTLRRLHRVIEVCTVNDGGTDWDAGTHLDELAAQLHRVVCMWGFGLGRRNGTARGVAGDLTSARLSIMLALLRRGPMRMMELAARHCVRRSTATTAVGRLERRGLVKRRYGTVSDQRAVLVDLTQRGHAHLAAVPAVRPALLNQLLSDFGEDNLRALRDALGPLDRLATLANCRQPRLKSDEGAWPALGRSCADGTIHHPYVAAEPDALHVTWLDVGLVPTVTYDGYVTMRDGRCARRAARQFAHHHT